MKPLVLFTFFILFFGPSKAQVDTINPRTLKLNAGALKEGTATYAVYFTDSIGNRMSSADIWDRTVSISTAADGKQHYNFEWTWWRKDTLQSTVWATGELASLAPLTHKANYLKSGKFSYVFNGEQVTVPEADRRTAKDSAFNVVMDPIAFEFPMDLELFPLLPFKKTGQRFAMAFYEPGSARSNYYPLTVTAKESLALPGGQSVNCWVLKIDYGRGSSASFWITDKTREVVKMQESFRGRSRYKVRLY
jgi:hypothetical protein